MSHTHNDISMYTLDTRFPQILQLRITEDCVEEGWRRISIEGIIENNHKIKPRLHKKNFSVEKSFCPNSIILHIQLIMSNHHRCNMRSERTANVKLLLNS